MQDPAPARPARDYTALLAIIALLLLAIAAVNAYAVYSTAQRDQVAEARAATYKERVEAVGKAAAAQRTAVDTLQSDCKKAIYDDPDTKGIMAQQFRVQECILEADELLAVQNSQIIELLSTVP